MVPFALVLFAFFSSAWGGVFMPRTIDPRLAGGRIVGGEKVNINEIPYQISMLHHGRHNCGGVILNENYVLTAGHCFMFVEDVSEVQVRFGSTNAVSGGLIIDAESYEIHEKYDANTTDFDVGVIKLAYPIRFDNNIKPAKLAEKDFKPETGSKVTVSGWGRLWYQGPIPEDLQKVDLQITDPFECYLSHVEHAEIGERQICAHVPEGGKDACNGDSGGPLTQNGVVIGLVSWGVDCAQPQWPGVYSNVAFYRDWIDQHSV